MEQRILEAIAGALGVAGGLIVGVVVCYIALDPQGAFDAFMAYGWTK